MPGSDASQFTRFKKLNVSQTDQNIQGIPKNKTINSFTLIDFSNC
jgi:hypothetical protein